MHQHERRQTVKKPSQWHWLSSLLLITLMGVSGNIWAHHPLDGIPMQFYWHGLLSGIAHPVLGIDHLAFIIAIAVTTVFSIFPYRTLIAISIGIYIGLASVFMGVQLPMFELAITLSLIAIGFALLFKLNINHTVFLIALTGLSVFHGIAYAQALVTPTDIPTVVILGFITGLSLIYCATLMLVRWFNGHQISQGLSTARTAQVIGLITVFIGATSY